MAWLGRRLMNGWFYMLRATMLIQALYRCFTLQRHTWSFVIVNPQSLDCHILRLLAGGERGLIQQLITHGSVKPPNIGILATA